MLQIGRGKTVLICTEVMLLLIPVVIIVFYILHYQLLFVVLTKHLCHSMEKLIEKSLTKVTAINMAFKRYLFDEIDWDNKLIGIKGARGTGKTTLILQHIKNQFGSDPTILYISLDDIYFSANRLVDLADTFVQNGGTHLFIDEVHKYRNWSQEIKNIYDDHKDLSIVFTSSSALQIDEGAYDLSRRAIIYGLHELSLREYISMANKSPFPVFPLEEILRSHPEICTELTQKIKPIGQFNDYIKYGAYPFILEGKTKFYERIEAVINQVIENDLPSITDIEYQTVIKIKKLLYVISGNVPFTPNISDLSRKTNTSRDLLLKYLDILDRAGLVKLLRSQTKGISYLSKPDKIFLNNTTLMHALNEGNVNPGSLRETFFMNQLSCKHRLTSARRADFTIDDTYTFEIGGRNKSADQIKGVENSYIAADNIEYGRHNKIPLWLFGFTY